MAKPHVKEQIVTAGLNLLHSRGFNATSVQDITEAAAVPKGSFYNHFASKEALGLEVLQRYRAAAAGYLDVLDDASQAPKARLRAYFDLLIGANTATDYNCGCLLGNFSSELSTQIPAMRDALHLAYDEWAAALTGVIAEGQRDGSIAAPQPALELAHFVIDAWQGAVLHAKASHSRAPLDRYADMVLNRILL
ncbi:TetR/AcrR family transcriptional regulator [Duganella violaceipulchra]|uniref:TetR/AcrR family transcriptional regulator n=1 Tax=Duganella violaceipulchra TaxID=2849652 RepID=A0AA41HAX1_9BURK|nr:TetR/AcrR family transcriptional regulator [Duganella violaceicalia]MBV6321482.1 TetR/AcrR family transcriptional regulator [Duganella violaceicalia]MCP2008261.1 TetR/AcrR family transcriptional repressor of nem operon [Duganella violaceicalia]